MKRLSTQMFAMVLATCFFLPLYAQTPRGISQILADQKRWQMRQLPSNSVLLQHQMGPVNAHHYTFNGLTANTENWLNTGRPLPGLALPATPPQEVDATVMGSGYPKKTGSSVTAVAYQAPRLETTFMQWLSRYQPKVVQ